MRPSRPRFAPGARRCNLTALGLLLLEIMMLMLALASLLTDVGAFGGLVSMKARIAPGKASTVSVETPSRVPKPLSKTLTGEFLKVDSTNCTRSMVTAGNESMIPPFQSGDIHLWARTTAAPGVTKLSVLGAVGKNDKLSSVLPELGVDGLDLGGGENVENVSVGHWQGRLGDRKHAKIAVLGCERASFLEDPENNFTTFWPWNGRPARGGGSGDRAFHGTNGIDVEWLFSGPKNGSSAVTFQSRLGSSKDGSHDICLLRLHTLVHAFDLAAGKRAKGWPMTRKRLQAGEALWFGIASILAFLGLCLTVMGVAIVVTGCAARTIYYSGKLMVTKMFVVAPVITGLRWGEVCLEFSSAGMATYCLLSKLSLKASSKARSGTKARKRCPNAPWEGQTTHRMVSSPLVRNGGQPRRFDDPSCSHQWFEMGFCDDLCCGDGVIWRCGRCALWYCDGCCERTGTGPPPLLNVIGEATLAAVNQLLHFLRTGNIPWRAVLFLSNLAFGESVTCRTCFDQIAGCTGGAACPLITTTTANGAILAGVAAGAATVLVARDVFPLRFTRVLHRGILDSLLVVGRRPPPGTPVDIGALTTAQLSDPVATAGVELDSMLQEVGTRLAAATSQLEVSRLNAITTNLTARQKLNSGAKGAVDLGDGTSAIVGVYRYCVVLALRIVRTKPTDVTVVTDGERAGSSEDGARVVPPAKLSRPSAENEFFGMLTVWTMLLAGLGVAPVLVSGVFLMDVVYTPLHEGTITWPTAFELFLVYLEEVEREAGDDVNLSNVYQRGAQDTFLMRARERTPKGGKARIFRPGSEDDDGAGIEWNGSWNRKSKSCCITFNLGNKKHPASAINERGGCKYNHVCDHWVDDKGPGGTCGGDHPRVKCNNPHKCDKELK